MRIIKSVEEGREGKAVSEAFDRIIRKGLVPLKFDCIQLNFPGFTDIGDDKLFVGLAKEDVFDTDRKIVEAEIIFELFRLFVRRLTEREMPRIVEDVVVAREMLKRGFLNELSYMLCASAQVSEALEFGDFLRLHAMSAAFHGHDKFYEDFLREIARKKSARRLDTLTSRFIDSLKSDLLDNSNLSRCIDLYEAVMRANY